MVNLSSYDCQVREEVRLDPSCAITTVMQASNTSIPHILTGHKARAYDEALVVATHRLGSGEFNLMSGQGKTHQNSACHRHKTAIRSSLGSGLELIISNKRMMLDR